MSHHHDEGHVHSHELKSLNKAFITGIILNTVFVITEAIAGLISGSMGLLSDAGHNLGDVTSLALAMLAFRLSQVKPNTQYTYGYRKSTILVSLFNAVLLFVAVIFIIIESIDKLMHPKPVEGGMVIIVAAIGVVINALTAMLFVKGKEKDINIKGAFLHMAADTLVSVGVVISGIIILLTDWYYVDSIIGLLIAVVITYSTWSLLRDSIRLSLDGVPSAIDASTVEYEMSQYPGVLDVHHIHIWGISTTETALTAHVVISEMQKMEGIKRGLKRLLETEGISHATLEFESQSGNCQKHCES